jgi:hypothetical protein
MVPLSFAGEDWFLTPSGALFRPRGNALLVADLHLEKASFFATYGQMLPPYDSRETLGRLADAVKETGARRVYCLGDSFHDRAAFARMEPQAAGMLEALTRAVDWVWITGNHDITGTPRDMGRVVDEAEDHGIILRHQARTGETQYEISGHFHPRLHLTLRDRRIRRPCAVISGGADQLGRMILPAFGALTGGMDAADPAIIAAMQPARHIDAVLPAQGRLTRFPLWRASK